MKLPITDPANYPIKPSDIDATKHFFDAFGSTETEISAGHIVVFCQRRGGWSPFTQAEINAHYYKQTGHANFCFNSLDTSGYIVKDGDIYRVTHEFVATCFASSPSQEIVADQSRDYRWAKIIELDPTACLKNDGSQQWHVCAPATYVNVDSLSFKGGFAKTPAEAIDIAWMNITGARSGGQAPELIVELNGTTEYCRWNKRQQTWNRVPKAAAP